MTDTGTPETLRWLRDADGQLLFFKHNLDLYSDELADPEDNMIVLKAVVRIRRKWIVAIPIEREMINEPGADDESLGRLNEEALYAAKLNEKGYVSAPQPEELLNLTVTRNTLLGFPFVADESMPPGRLEMLLEEDERNVTGLIELHGRSLVAMPGDSLQLFFKGELVTTIEFVSGQLAEYPSEPEIGPELQRFVDFLRSVH
jgi:hypothetical protein